MCPFHVQLASETKQKPRNEKRKKNSSDMLKLGSLVVQVSKCECNKIIKDIVVSVQWTIPNETYLKGQSVYYL